MAPEIRRGRRAQNYGSHVQWIIGNYNQGAAKGFVHGFQKDAIQNAVGARKRDDYRGWKVCIDVVNTEHGTFVVVEDFGTVGLTGHNFPLAVLTEKTRANEQFPAEERLARISCDNVSGGDPRSPGLYGVGKTLYVGASRRLMNYFESRTEEEGYRCNFNDNDEMNEVALEGAEGEEWFKAQTGLDPIDHIGTRFVVVDPKEEIVEGILGEAKEMLHDAEETWWRVIRLLNPDEGIFINGERAEVPAIYVRSEDQDYSYKDHYFSNVPTSVEPGYRFKRIGFYISDDIPEELSGFYYYRRGMKIGKIKLDEFERDIDSKYYGFIELEPAWEDQLGIIEDMVHYDTMGTFKNKCEYAYMRDAVRKIVAGLLTDWGYRRTEVNQTRMLNAMLDEINQQVSDLFSANGFERIGTGNKSSAFSVRLTDVRYPHSDEEKYGRSLFENETLSFGFEVRNKTLRNLRYKIGCMVRSQDGTVSQQIYNEIVPVSPEAPYVGTISFTANSENSIVGKPGSVILTVCPTSGSKKPISRKLYYYFQTETYIRPEDDFEFDIRSFDFENSPSKRINTDEWVRNISYTLINRTEKPVKVILKVNTNNGEGRKELLSAVVKREYILPPFGEEVGTEPFDIQFSAEEYFSKIRRGIIDVKARMILNEDLPDNVPPLDRSTILGEYKFRVFFNKPDSAGNNFDHRLIDDENNHRRVYLDPELKNTIDINIGHPQYKLCTDQQEQQKYLSEMLIRGYILVFDSNGYFDNAETAELSPQGYAEYLNDKIEEMWFKQCEQMR